MARESVDGGAAAAAPITPERGVVPARVAGKRADQYVWAQCAVCVYPAAVLQRGRSSALCLRRGVGIDPDHGGTAQGANAAAVSGHAGPGCRATDSPQAAI